MCTHLFKRGSRYYIRRRVPTDRVPILGKSEVTRALGTSVRAEAVELCRLEGVRLDEEWAKLRAAAQAKKALDNVVTAAQSEADAARRTREDAEREREEAEEWYQSIVSYARDEGLDEDEALAFDRDVERCVQMEREVQRRLKEEAKQQTGQIADRTQPRPSHTPKTLRDVVPSWATRTDATDDAKRRAEKAQSLFEQAVGVVPPLNELKKADGAAFVLFLLDSGARGFRPKTAHNHASYISALLNVAEKDDLIDRNPLDLTINKNTGAKKRAPWTDAELKLMDGHALFSERMADVLAPM